MIELQSYLFKDPVAALTTIKERAYDHERFSIEEYLDILAQSLWRFNSIGVDIQGDNLEEKCANCLQQLVDHGMIEIIH